MTNAGASFGEVLRRLRTAASLSQEALAKRAGLSTRGISDLERGVRRLPHLSTVRLLADALDLGAADRAALLTAARPASVPASRGGLPDSPAPFPIPLTSLVGREYELADLVSLMELADARLVTLTGAGGTGKTRLALEIGRRLGGEYADGVVFVDLTPVRDADLVLPAIAGALGVRERFGEPLVDTLARGLSPREMLLILDNCEQVLAAAPDIAGLVAASPRLSLLATSREPLHVRGEHIFSLQPLPVPAGVRRFAIEELARVPSVALFVERTAAIHQDFALTAGNASHVAAICRRLDGLPLAIELAAARTGVLSPAGLLSRLEQRLPLLTGGGRDLPPRQRTMRDAIAWSHDLLAPAEQALFRRLAVFSGGWTLDAAEAVCGGCPDLDVLAALEALTDANLVQATGQPRGERRFAMLETVREFGMDQLVNRGEADDLGRRHARYFLALAQGTDGSHAAGGGWLTRLEDEEANVRAALAWFRDHGHDAAGLRLAVALAPFWHVRSANAEGRAWLETFLAASSINGAPADRIEGLRWAGELAGLQGDAAAAETHLRQSLSLARETDDSRGVANALRAIGSAAIARGDFATGIATLEEATTLSRTLGDLRQTAFLLAYLGYAIAHQGDLAQGQALATDSEELLRSPDDAFSFEADLAVLVQGWLAIMRGDFDQAEDRLDAAVGLGRVLSAKANLSVALAGLAEIALARGKLAEAVRLYREGLLLGWEGEFPAGMVFNLQGLIHVGGRRGEFAAVAPLVAALDAFGQLVLVLPTAIYSRYQGDGDRVRSVLGQDENSAAWRLGTALSLDEIVEEALEFSSRLRDPQTEMS